MDGALAGRDRAFLGAMREMQVVRDFVGSPENILGRADTKHGEIAEQVHVGVRRAWAALEGRAPAASFEGVGRLAPEDYIDGVPVQSKYINGLRNTLDHVQAHAEKYLDFSEGDTRYHIPFDQQAQLAELRATGTIEGLSPRRVETIRRKLAAFEELTGRDPATAIEGGEASYAEVQRGRVHKTIEDREGKLDRRSEEMKEQVRSDHAPSLSGLAQAAALGGVAGGGVRIGQALFVKYREGKNPFKGEFTSADWSDVGVAGGKGAGAGAAAGGALYLLTNSTDLAAPFAGSLVSALMGVGDLLTSYHSGEIDGDQFVELSHLVASDAAIVGLAAAAGQAMIPIPMLGAFVGSLAGKIVASALKDGLGKSEAELTERLAAYEREALRRLDADCRRWMERLDLHFARLDRLATLAFDPNTNTELRLRTSVEFAQTLGVREDLILHSTRDVDAFMTE